MIKYFICRTRWTTKFILDYLLKATTRNCLSRRRGPRLYQRSLVIRSKRHQELTNEERRRMPRDTPSTAIITKYRSRTSHSRSRSRSKCRQRSYQSPKWEQETTKYKHELTTWTKVVTIIKWISIDAGIFWAQVCLRSRRLEEWSQQLDLEVVVQTQVQLQLQSRVPSRSRQRRSPEPYTHKWTLKVSRLAQNSKWGKPINSTIKCHSPVEEATKGKMSYNYLRERPEKLRGQRKISTTRTHHWIWQWIWKWTNWVWI